LGSTASRAIGIYIKYIGKPTYISLYENSFKPKLKLRREFIKIKAGLYDRPSRKHFCFDNELGKAQSVCNDFEISNKLVTNKEYLDFITAGGYQNFNFWHDEGWSWVNTNNIEAPILAQNRE
jgi:formylglycine-generating enzyme required for sulfatase activity